MKDLIDQIIAEEFASPDLELVWLSEDDNDLGKNEQALESRLKLGALTLNELRDGLGLDPYQNPAADRPMVLTASGYVPIEANAGGEGAEGERVADGQSASATFAPAVAKRFFTKDYNPDQPRVPAGGPQGGQWTNEGSNALQTSNGRTDDRSDRGKSPPAQVNDPRVISDATPYNTWIPGERYAGGIEEGEGESRIRGQPAEGTPAQEARLAVAEVQWEDVRNRMRSIDPYWKPPGGIYETIEGSIADLEAKTQAAEAHIAELANKGIGPGRFACEYIPAQGPGRLNTAERVDNNQNGDKYGCHTCGTRVPGTPSGSWVGDHQPSSALNIFGLAQRIYPQCLACSQRQGGAVMGILGGLP